MRFVRCSLHTAWWDGYCVCACMCLCAHPGIGTYAGKYACVRAYAVVAIRCCFFGSGWVGRAALARMQSVWCWTVLPRKKGRRNLFVRTVLVGCLLYFVIVVGARRMSPRLGRKYSVLSYACPVCLPWSNRQDVVGSQQAMVSLGPNL